MYLFGPIREISVQRRGTRVKRFFVSEARMAELENLTEYRRIKRIINVIKKIINPVGHGGGAPFWIVARPRSDII
jgi:hypothetical protein